jgi:SAM-dependent methyltransferase
MSAPSTSYTDIIASLRSAYDGSAAERDSNEKSEWKLVERSAFLERVQGERKSRLLELGAGTGHDSAYFQEHGLEVIATDISPEMVARCRAKGLDARVMDFLNLTFPAESFDVGYAFNSLLHVPNSYLPAVLLAIQKVLAPDALLYLGMYGGEPFEGLRVNDWHNPPRFFSFRSDEELLRMVSPYFEVVDFHVVTNEGIHFQALTLRRPNNRFEPTRSEQRAAQT